MLRQVERGLEASVEMEALHQALCFGSKDAKEGIDAFLEKRPAQFIPPGYVMVDDR